MRPRVQKSVFECSVNALQREQLIHRLLGEIEPAEDSLRIHRLTEPRQQHMWCLGRSRSPIRMSRWCCDAGTARTVDDRACARSLGDSFRQVAQLDEVAFCPVPGLGFCDVEQVLLRHLRHQKDQQRDQR